MTIDRLENGGRPGEKPRVVAIVQARTGSTRLPGKVLRPLAGKPVLARVVERLHAARGLDEIVVAIPSGPEDDPLETVARELNATVVRGPNEDVLRRYVLAAQEADADVVVRLTADCPLIDPATVDRTIDRFGGGDVDFVIAGQAGGFPLGLDTEVVHAATLEALDRADLDPSAREHVTLALYRPEGGYRVLRLSAPSDLRRPDLRLCVDEEADYLLLSAIYERLHRPGEIIPIATVVELLSREPALAAINRNVRQRRPT